MKNLLPSLFAIDPPSWFDFLRLEAELALTFTQSAKLYSDPKNSARALEHARKALAEIQHATADRAKYGLSDDEVVFLEKRCVGIEAALNELKIQT